MSDAFAGPALMLEFLTIRDGLSPLLLALLALPWIAGLIWAIYTDLKRWIIPDLFTLPAIALTAIAVPFVFEHPLMHYITGVVAGAFFWWLTTPSAARFIGRIGRGTERDQVFGLGDTKLLTAGGLLLGPALVLALMVASLTGIVAALVLQAMGRFNTTVALRDQYIPFGPHIALSFIVVGVIGFLI